MGPSMVVQDPSWRAVPDEHAGLRVTDSPRTSDASSREGVRAALLEFRQSPGKYRVAVREPALLFECLREVLQFASGRDVDETMRQAACFFTRTALLYPGADHYSVMGLDPKGDLADLKDRYRLMMRLLHPDFAGSDPEWPPDAAVRVNRAYEVLSSPVQRRGYDERLEPVHGVSRPARPETVQRGPVVRPPQAQPPRGVPRMFIGGGALICAIVAVASLFSGGTDPVHLVQRSQPPQASSRAALVESEGATTRVQAPVAVKRPEPPVAARSPAPAPPAQIALPPPAPAVRTLLAVAPVQRDDPLPVAVTKTESKKPPTPQPIVAPPLRTASVAPPAVIAGPAVAHVITTPAIPPSTTLVPQPAVLPAPMAAAAVVPPPAPSAAATPAPQRPEVTAAPASPPAAQVALVAAPRPAPKAGLTLVEAQPLLSQLLQLMESGRGERILNLLDVEARSKPSAQALSRGYDSLVDGVRPVKLSHVEFRAEPLEGRLLVVGSLRLLAGEQTIGSLGKKMMLRAEFASRDGVVVITGLSGGPAN
jgi:hypothetical protein